MSLISKVQQPDSHGRIQHVTPESAGWEYVGFDAYLLKKGQTLRLSSGERELGSTPGLCCLAFLCFIALIYFVQ